MELEFNVLFAIHFMVDILTKPNELSIFMQQDNVDLPSLDPMVGGLNADLQSTYCYALKFDDGNLKLFLQNLQMNSSFFWR